jgi:hypothetical protein
VGQSRHPDPKPPGGGERMAHTFTDRQSTTGR